MRGSGPRRRDGVSVTQRRLAFVSIGGWLVAAAGASRVGIWPAIGGVAICLGLLVWTCDREETRRSLRPQAAALGIGALAGGVMAAGTYLVYPLLAGLSPEVASDTTTLYASFRQVPGIVAWLVLGPVILGEELVWRGAVQTVAAGWSGARGGVVVASALYALAHVPVGSPVLVLAAFVCGACWSGLRMATGSLVAPVVAHLLWDVLVLLWLPIA